MEINIYPIRDKAIRRAMHILGDTLEWKTPIGEGIWEETDQTEEVRDLTWGLQACLDPDGMTKEGIEAVGRFMARETEEIGQCPTAT